MINNLVGILLGFRENPVAVMADIEAMFMQVANIESDQSALRFLWPTEKGIFHCSPTIAISILNKTAQDFAPNQYIKDLVKRSFYMDDFVQSFETAEKKQKRQQEN